jgi:hypothetical protein
MRLEDRIRRLEERAGVRGECGCKTRPVEVVFPDDPPREIPAERECGKCGGVYQVDVVRIEWETEAQ